MDIGLVAKLNATPTRHKDMTRAEQEADLEKKCGDMLAPKVLALMERLEKGWTSKEQLLMTAKPTTTS